MFGFLEVHRIASCPRVGSFAEYSPLGSAVHIYLIRDIE